MVFVKGQQKYANSGRTKGIPNKVTQTVKDAFKEAFDIIQEDNAANLGTWGRMNPDKFYPLAAKLIPIDSNVSGTMNIQWPLPKTELDE